MTSPRAHRIVVLFLLLLYVGEIFGTMTVFTGVRAQIRREVKQRIKASVPPAELVRFVLHPGNRFEFHWIHDREFRFRGSLYDVVRSDHRGDTTLLACINDVQEERLFAGLDALVRRQMEQDPRTAPAGQAGPAGPVFHHLLPPPVPAPAAALLFLFSPSSPPAPASPVREVPEPPPRSV
jgi:hypothetical protein